MTFQKKTNDKTYKKSIIRISDEYQRLMKWLEYNSINRGLLLKDFVSEIFSFSLDFLEKNKTLNFNFQGSGYTRTPKGIFMSSDVSNRFYEKYESCKNDFSDKLFVADFAELIFYIYCTRNLTKKDLKHLNIDWKITELP